MKKSKGAGAYEKKKREIENTINACNNFLLSLKRGKILVNIYIGGIFYKKEWREIDENITRQIFEFIEEKSQQLPDSFKKQKLRRRLLAEKLIHG